MEFWAPGSHLAQPQALTLHMEVSHSLSLILFLPRYHSIIQIRKILKNFLKSYTQIQESIN